MRPLMFHELEEEKDSILMILSELARTKLLPSIDSSLKTNKRKKTD